MKREYSTPTAYFETFTANQFAGGCQPGISEDGLEPITQKCYFYNSSGSAYEYNLASTRTCSRTYGKYDGNGSCTHVDATQTVITSKTTCSVQFDNENTSKLVTIQMSLKGGDVQPVYVWSNGSTGYHKMPTSYLKVDNPTDSEGRPYYFNS